MIQSLLDGTKHCLVSLVLLSLIEICLLLISPDSHSRIFAEAKKRACMYLHIPTCTPTPDTIRSHVRLFGPSVCLSIISDAKAVKLLISSLMVLQVCSVFFSHQRELRLSCPLRLKPTDCCEGIIHAVNSSIVFLERISVRIYFKEALQ